MPVARLAFLTAVSGASDVPPGLTARIATWSALNVVGLSSTRAPFDSVHSVASMLAIFRSDTTRPGVGCFATSGASPSVSR
jgi:hypothetical protein